MTVVIIAPSVDTLARDTAELLVAELLAGRLPVIGGDTVARACDALANSIRSQGARFTADDLDALVALTCRKVVEKAS